MSAARSFAAAIFLLNSFLPAQQFVDSLPGEKHLYDPADRGVYHLGPDMAIQRFSLPVPDDLGLFGRPRPKIRQDSLWISNGKKIYGRPLETPGETSINVGWEQMKLPDGIERFCDFDVISDTEAMVCGCIWKTREDNDKIPLRHDLHFIFNHKTGTLTKTIEELDPKGIHKATPQETVFGLLKESESYVCRFNSYILIVGKWSGSVTVVDANGGSPRKFTIVPGDEMPSDPEAVVNSGSAIAWAGPLGGDEALLCCRKWPAADQPGGRPASAHCFRTLNLKTGKVVLEGPTFRGREARSDQTLLEENGGILSVGEAIAGHMR